MTPDKTMPCLLVRITNSECSKFKVRRSTFDVRLLCSTIFCIWIGFAPSLSAAPRSSEIAPPAPLREFRAAWVATVANIDWPSRKDLTTAEQKAELLAILDRAQHLKLNAIIFQVRPACDALYASAIEPWSEYLTGTMGK